MADFCGQCEMRLFGEITKPDIDKGCLNLILCEGCGRQVWIDHTGLRVECGECRFAHEGTCDNVAGDNCWYTSEISGEGLCKNFIRREVKKMASRLIKMALEKETKGTYRFKSLDENEIAVTTLYVGKEAFSDRPANGLTVTIDAEELTENA